MKNKRIFIMLMVMVLCVSMIAFSYDKFEDRKYEPNMTTDTDDKFDANSCSASLAYQNMMDIWRKDDLNKRDLNTKAYTVDGITAEGYPEYYGGSYLNEEGNLVVLLTKEYSGGFFGENAKSRKAKEELRETTGKNDIIFGEVKHSLKELIKTKEAIAEYKWAKKEEKYKISGAELNVDENSVTVYIYPLNEDSERWFRETIADDEWIVFEERDPNAVEATVSVVPGTEISSPSSNFSVGFRAYQGSTMGFVTCGHPFQGISSNVNISKNGTVIGSSYANERKFSGSLDAAFVRVNSGNTVTNTVHDANNNISYTMSPGYLDPINNQVVYMAGKTSSVTGNVLQGRVTKVAADAEYNGVYLTDLYKMSYVPQLGDSGGIVFTASSVYKPCGIQVARDVSNSCSYVCKASNIAFDLRLTIK